ncbi:PREDICTED: uncharacterized protein LOC109180151 [Ipomoea nil]|uniref:uncharacterized protein LOC109180151 n=1 Tax=Ipomoea nil TaxID=35883 RepID=UPI00090198CA|nr:PREDICTED: uncharacterized protein LOC109180151 [Ipomoea nil]
MDSGNSGSLQSSSGGDEEYDSRGDSFSAFMTKTAAAGHITHHLSQPPQTAMFSPLLSNYFDPTLQPPTFSDQNSIPLLNLDMAWSRTLRSDPCSPQINPAVLPSAGSSAHQKVGVGVGVGGVSFPSTAEAHASGSVTAADAAAAGKDHGRVMRNPKKRSRASRRAPTTVLTTDTTNFRAMVQEFTGIPAPPFTSSPFPRTRFDIFGTPSALRSAGTHLNTSQPPYLRRPFPQKIQQPPPPFLPPPPLDSLASSSTNNLFTIPHNSILSSLLQSSPNEFGSVNTALTGLPSLISPDQAVAASSRRSETGWGGGGLRPTANDDQLPHHHFSNNGENNGNHNIPTASSNFLGDKAPENVSGRGEGMTESWICSSDLK